jgi:hypothetical protein
LRFTLHGDQGRRLSTCTNGPSGRDIDCRVHICVRSVAALLASEHRLALAVVRCAMAANSAGLRRIGGIDQLDPAGRLVLQSTHKQPPTVGKYPSIEPGLRAPTVRPIPTGLFDVRLGFGPSGHRDDAQRLHTDHIEPQSEVGAGLLHPVFASVCRACIQPRDRNLDSRPPSGAAAAAGQAALQRGKSGLLGHGPGRARQEFSCREGCRHLDAAVHPDDCASAGCGDRLWDDRERKMPAACSIGGDAVGLRVGNRTRESEPHPTDLRHQHLRPLAVQLTDTRCLGSDDTETLASTGFTPGGPPTGAGVETLDGLVEIPQRLLLHSLRAVPQPSERRSRLSQLPSLLDVSRCRTFVARPHRPLLERQVPHIPRMAALLLQGALLRGRRIQPEPGHEIHPISRDRQSLIPERRESRFSALKAGAYSRLLK